MIGPPSKMTGAKSASGWVHSRAGRLGWCWRGCGEGPACGVRVPAHLSLYMLCPWLAWHSKMVRKRMGMESKTPSQGGHLGAVLTREKAGLHLH